MERSRSNEATLQSNDISPALFSNTSQNPVLSRRLLSHIVWTAVIIIHILLLITSITGIFDNYQNSTRFIDSAIFLTLSGVFAVSTLVLSGWKFAWLLLLGQSILAGLVTISSSGFFIAQSILLSAVLMEAMLLWSGRNRIAISIACVLLSVLVVIRYEVILSSAISQSIGAMVVGTTVAIMIGLADSAFFRLSKSDEELAVLREAIGRITEANVQYQDYAMNVADESSLEERLRISRDLHDVVGLTFTNTIAMMNAVLTKPLSTVEEQRELYEWVRDTAQSGLRNTRSILYELRSVPEQRRPTIEIIGRILDAFMKATNMNVEVKWGNLPRFLPPSTTSALTHLIQEALVNSFRHGRASHVQLYFQYSKEVLDVTVTDNGTGGATGRHGIGQSGIAERLQKLEGTVEFGSSPLGYQVKASIPVAEVSI